MQSYTDTQKRNRVHFYFRQQKPAGGELLLPPMTILLSAPEVKPSFSSTINPTPVLSALDFNCKTNNSSFEKYEWSGFFNFYPMELTCSL